MELIHFLKTLFSTSKENKLKTKRRALTDVKPNDWVKIEWWRVKGKIAWLKCINNDPETRKIVLQIKWNNYKESDINEYEQIVFKYEAIELENFFLLNPHINPDAYQPIDDTNLAELQRKLNEALEKENYEIAGDLQRKIDKLVKK